MSVSFSTILSSLRLNLRDPNTTTWSDEQLGELTNRGIDAVSAVYPNETIDSVAYTQPVSGSVFTVALSNVRWVTRVDVYDNDGKFRETVRPSSGDGPNSGWETHGGILSLPPRYSLSAGTGTFKIVGYGDWLPISCTYTTAGVAVSPSTATTNLDTAALNAVKVFVEAEALSMLTLDRAQYQQWQVSRGAADLSALGMNNLALAAQQRWRQEQRKIRRLRKWG